jgi:dienelactone hydrolase
MSRRSLLTAAALIFWAAVSFSATQAPRISEKLSPVLELKVSPTSYAAYRIPPGDGPFPAVLLLHGGLGQSEMEVLRRNVLTQPTTTRFLAWGYAVFSATRRSIAHDPQDRGLVDDTVALVEAVGKLPSIDRRSITLYGGSGGGTLALEVAAETDLAAIVAGEPATIIFMGMLSKEHVAFGPEGKPTSDQRNDIMAADPKSLYTAERRKLTREKIAKIRCDTLILHGDQHPLEKFNRQLFVPEMQAMGKSVHLEMYPGQRHGFYFGQGDDPAIGEKSNRDAEAFLRERVKVKPKPLAADQLEWADVEPPAR